MYIYYIYTTPVPFHSFLSSVFCVLSFWSLLLCYSFSLCVCVSLFDFWIVLFWPPIVYLFLLYFFVVLIFPYFLYYSCILLFFSQSFSFSSNRLYVLFPSWHTIMCSVVSYSVLERGHFPSDSFLLYLHFLFHTCNLIFMISFVALLSHFLIYCFLSHLSFRSVWQFIFPAYILSFFFSYFVCCFPF